MNSWIAIALLAHFLYALAYLLDKFILSSSIRSPLSYAFYVGVLGGFVIFLAPFFPFYVVHGQILFYSLLGGALFSIGLVCFYRTLQVGEASRSVPLIGALVPIVTLIFSHILGIDGIEGHYVTAFICLVAGSFFIGLGYKNSDFWHIKNITILVFAAVFFGISYALTKVVFIHTNFITGFIWVRMGSLAVALVLISHKKWRQEIFTTTTAAAPSAIGWFFGSKIIGAVATVLQNYAIFLGSVVLVNSMQATQYLFLLLFASLLSWKFPALFQETIGRAAIAQKILAIIFIGVGLTVLAIPSPKPRNVVLGVTFSQKFSEELGLDWRQAYRAMLEELKVKHIRLIAYWDSIEPQDNESNFTDLDWQISEAKKRGVDVILAMGRKNPRWPECHEPVWVRTLPKIIQHEKLLEYLTAITVHYKKEEVIAAWQIENNPLFPSKDCASEGLQVLKDEVATVRMIDSRKIMLTDAGELGFAWPMLVPQSDIFGTTLYRYTHNKILGDIQYWFIPSGYFRLKAWFAHKLFKKDVVISELQAEPRVSMSLADVPLKNQYDAMNPVRLREIIRFAKISGFPRAYLWGVEWWYWLKDKKGDPSMWYVAEELIKNSYVEHEK